MHAQHMDIILIFARTRDVGLCRPCLHEKKTDMEQFGKILIVDDNEDVLFCTEPSSRTLRREDKSGSDSRPHRAFYDHFPSGHYLAGYEFQP